MNLRLAIISSHPIQYYAPWFQSLALEAELEIHVFYLWDFGVRPTHDSGFGQTFSWDVPLLDGYEHSFVPNTSSDPGTHHWRGLQNPQLKKAVLDWKPDAILMIGYAQQSFLKWILNPLMPSLPLILKGDSHRLVPATSAKSWLKNLMLFLLFKNFSAFLYCGKANLEYFRYRGAQEQQLFFSPHAIDLERYSSTPETQAAAYKLRERLKIGADIKVILFAGKYELKKKPLDLLAAYLRCRRPDTRLLFAGSGEHEPELRKQAEGLADIIFLPLQNQSQMPALYHAADLFVLPSYGPSETWGLAVQESLACGTPVIVSSHVGCHLDLVQNQNNGLIFQAGSINSLTDALRQALQPKQLETWSKQCRHALARYTYTEATLGLKKALAALVHEPL